MALRARPVTVNSVAFGAPAKFGFTTRIRLRARASVDGPVRLGSVVSLSNRAPRAVVAQLERVDGALRGVLRRAAPDEQPATVDRQAVAALHVAVAALDGDLRDPGRRRLRRVGAAVVVAAIVAVAAERD